MMRLLSKYKCVCLELVLCCVCCYVIYYGLSHKNISAVVVGFIALIAF